MADEKKPEGKPNDKGPAPAKDDPFMEIIGFVIILVLFSTLVNGLMRGGFFSRGLSGLNKESIVLSHTRPISTVQDPIGASIINNKETSVYDSPGGQKRGKQATLSNGRIIQGPVEINGVRHWFVDYEKDPDGWVSEDDIAYITGELNTFEKIIIFILGSIKYLKIIIIIFSVSCIIIIYFLLKKINELLLNEKKLLYPKLPEMVKATNPQWERILSHSESVNENDWRLAIIESDIMLGELLEKMALPGESIGDKLKVVEKSDFLTQDSAWEAHKARNHIAHEGAGFRLSQHEAKKIISLYKSVFDEFGII